MAKIDYTKLAGVSNDVDSLCVELTNATESCSAFPAAVEPRINEYYSSYFSNLSKAEANLDTSIGEMSNLGTWLNDLIAEGQALDASNASSVPSSHGSTGGSGVDSNPSPTGGAAGAGAAGTGGDGAGDAPSPTDGATGAGAAGTGGVTPGTTPGTTGGATGAGAEGTGGVTPGTTPSTTGGATGAGAEGTGGVTPGTTPGTTGGATGAGAARTAGAGVLGGLGVTGGAAGAAAAAVRDALEGLELGSTPLDSLLLSSIAGLGSIFSLNSSDADKLAHYGISQDEWDKLTPEEQDAIKAKLKELGYTDKEIEDIINGKKTVLSCVQDAIAAKLEQLLKDNPELRQKLIDIYGIDIFNPDGTVNKAKLTLLFLMDEKSSKDTYSIINLLHNEFGVDLVSSSRISDMMSKLLKALKKSSLIRKLLIKRYGFDIFNKDGTINYERLVKALLMDDVSPNDAFDLGKLIDEFNKGNGLLILLKSYFGGGFLSFFGAGTAVVSGSILAFGIGSKIFKNYKNSKNPILKEGTPSDRVEDDEKYFNISKDRLSRLNNEILIYEKTLLEAGYNSSDLIKFKEGKYSVLRKLLEELISALEVIVVDHDEVREKISQLYGFNIFEGDKVIKTKLAIVILIDFKDDIDRFDIIKLLNENYDLNIIVEDAFNKVVDLLEENVKKNPDDYNLLNDMYKDKLIENDGSVDRDVIKDLLAKEYRDSDNKSNNTLLEKLNNY